MNVCEGSFTDIHERLLSAKSGRSSWPAKRLLTIHPDPTLPSPGKFVHLTGVLERSCANL